MKGESDMAQELSKKVENAPAPQYSDMATGYLNALNIVDNIVLKNYITELSTMEVVALEEKFPELSVDDIRIFRITEMVYEKEELSFHKFVSVFNTLVASNATIFVILDSDGNKTDFYMGVQGINSGRTTAYLRDTLENAMKGQFPGIKTSDYDIDEMQKLISNFKGNNISVVSCVADNRTDEQDTDTCFVQGLEKLVLSMSGQRYTGIIIAHTSNQQQLRALRRGYENVYTQLSPFASVQVSYGQNSATGKTTSTSDAISETKTDSVSQSTTDSTNSSRTESETETCGTTEENSLAKMCKGLSVATGVIGAALAPVTGGASLAVGGVVSGSLGLLGNGASITRSESISNSTSNTFGESRSNTSGTSTAKSAGRTQTSTFGSSITEGLSQGTTLTAHDKSVEDMLSRIDKQIVRIDEFESLGMYECAAYFLADERHTADIAAATYKALMSGENSGVEISAVNTWGVNDGIKTEMIKKYVTNFIHPIFKYNNEIEVTPAAMVSGNELAIHLGLPRKSVCGLPVIEHADFGKEVVKYSGENPGFSVTLGNIFHMGSTYRNEVKISGKDLAMHTLVTGSTGSGKSNTIYEILDQVTHKGAKFMVIEPAKGEYKHVFGNRVDVSVFGTNPHYSALLKINPFAFPEKIHVLEHIDRLIEIFNVCWPMYAAMPAVLKDALLTSYEDCGWDLVDSVNQNGVKVYPTFIDLQEALTDVIKDSSYSQEIKGNYVGALITRVNSLTNGLNAQIFTADEVDNADLFDENVIVDLSRIGSPETKALIMGTLIMRLNEYRMSEAKVMNELFKHVTVLEEAHNILKRTSTDQNPENPSLTGKAVEMLSNAIAEMRTYGEGFIIVDQSPGAVDISAVRNTNTKIIMRLPEKNDRYLAGKASGLRDEQLEEIAKLPKGVAVVYQNDWVEPVLCKIRQYDSNESEYKYSPDGYVEKVMRDARKNILLLLLQGRVDAPVVIDVGIIKENLNKLNLSAKDKLIIIGLLKEYEQYNKLSLWSDDKFEILNKIVSNVVNGRNKMKKATGRFTDIKELFKETIKVIRAQVKDLPVEYIKMIVRCMIVREAGECEEYKEKYVELLNEFFCKG